MLDLLEHSLAKPGNGGAGEYGFVRHVRNDSGFNANRTFDGVSVNLWPSRGHDIHAYEVKVSRSDWKKELARPDKAEDAAKIADRFSIVAPGASWTWARCLRHGVTSRPLAVWRNLRISTVCRSVESSAASCARCEQRPCFVIRRT